MNMSVDVYGKRKMYSSGTIFLLFIPIGAIILFYLYDFCANFYKQKQVEKTTYSVMSDVLNREGLEGLEEMKIYAKKVFEEYDITEDDFSLTQVDDYYLLTVYDSYISVVGELSFGFLRNKEVMVHASYKGYYNEYKEAVIEKFEDSNDELSDFNDNDESEDEEIIIN
jgi:hypothetical protein